MSGTERSGTGTPEGGVVSGTGDGCAAHVCGVPEGKIGMEMTKDVVAGPKHAGTLGQAAGSAPEKTLPPELQGHLGARLRAVYGALVNEPVPDKFFQLLKELEAKEKGGKS